MDLRPYKPGPIEPVCLAGENVLLAGRQGFTLYTVAYIEPLSRSAPLVQDLGSLAPGVPSALTSTENYLDAAYGQLQQIRVRVLDDINVTIYQPQAQARQANQNITALINAFGALYDPDDHMSEFFIFEDQRPYVQAVNPTQYTNTKSRLSYYGYKYVLSGAGGTLSSGGKIAPLASFTSIKDAVESNKRFTVVPIGGWGR